MYSSIRHDLLTCHRGIGGASLKTPRFGNYSDQVGKELFAPPYSLPWKDGVYVGPSVFNVTLSVIFLPSALTTVYTLTTAAWRRFAPSRVKSDQWRPWVFRRPFLLFLNLTTLSHLILVQFLRATSERPDLRSSGE